MQGQHPSTAETLVARAETIAVPDMVHDATVEGLPRTREISPSVQHRRNVSVRVGVEQLIDHGHDFGVGLSQLPGVHGAGERERGGGTAPKTEVRGETIGDFDERDVLHQQADHPLAFTIGRVGVVPEPWEVRRQRENPRARLAVNAQTVGVSVSISDLLRVDDLPQGAIPLGF